jgi:hypothetical protein
MKKKGEEEKKVEGGALVVRDTTIIKGGKRKIPALKFLRQCPLVRLAAPG